MKLLIGLGILLAVAGLGWLLWAKRELDEVATELPARLKKCRVWAKEKQFETDLDGAILVARIDESYVDEEGVIWLSETKSRAQPVVYQSDILQLSAGKMAIERSTGISVSKVGYVRLLTPVGNEFREVRLLEDAEVIAACVLYEDVRAARYRGEKTTKKRLCATCAYRADCT